MEGAPHRGHDRHAGHSVAMFRDRFWLSLALTIPVVLWSADVQEWLGYTAPTFPGSTLIPPILGTVVFLYGGLVFLRGARRRARATGQPGMMTLISLAIMVAFVTSWAGTLGLFEVEIWWELATLITIMLLGHWLEMRSIAQARGALAALAELLPDTAERVAGDATRDGPARRLARRRRRPRPARAPACRPTATVVEGTRRRRRVDDHRRVAGGREGARRPRSSPAPSPPAAACASGSTAVGEETALSGIMRLVAAAQASASRAQALADRAAALLFYVALAAGA